MSKNLVELMASRLMDFDTGLIESYKDADGWEKEIFKERSRMLLSVVKEHIGEVAQTCFCCYGGGCNICKGYGVIARTEGDI
jgi:hypothetical protein